jgi:hypothetical protein
MVKSLQKMACRFALSHPAGEQKTYWLRFYGKLFHVASAAREKDSALTGATSVPMRLRQGERELKAVYVVFRCGVGKNECRLWRCRALR